VQIITGSTTIPSTGPVKNEPEEILEFVEAIGHLG
jgi:hypothetical protein